MAEEALSLTIAGGCLAGSLQLAEGSGRCSVALLVAGSGPTDRDGNNFLLDQACDNLKLLAGALARQGIASLRYDKRGVGASAYPGLREDALRFDQLVDDAVALGRALQRDARFGDVLLVGHSEGALIASLAAEVLAPRGLVCVAGAGERASALIRRQLQPRLPPPLLAAALAVLGALDAGQLTEHVPDELVLLLRPSVQPYLASWFRHDPAEVLARVPAPALLVHGELDAQVDLEQAHRLRAGRPQAPLRVVPDMDHLLAVDGDYTAGTAAVASAVARWLRELQGDAVVV